jgi:hypothetical protein
LIIKLKNILGVILSLKTNFKLRIQVCYNIYYFQVTEKHIKKKKKRVAYMQVSAAYKCITDAKHCIGTGRPNLR